MTNPLHARPLLEEITATFRATQHVESPALEARWVLEAVTGKRHPELVLLDPALDDEAVRNARDFAARRVDGEPLQYIVGLAGFRTLELDVGLGVFIPRPETEVVAGRAMEYLPNGGTLVDVGTGSGAIALAVASERPDAHVYATERSQEALAWALRNRDRLRLPVRFTRCDLLDGLPADLEGHVDVIVSNPPYVAWSERDRLPADVVDHEPHEALFAEGEGLHDLRRIAEDALRWLSVDGWLVMEIGETQGEEALQVLSALGYRSASVDVDLAGRDRLVQGMRPA